MDSLVYEAKLYGLDAVFAFTYVPEFFAKVGFGEVERGELPLKAWKDCLRCPKFHSCDEIAVLRVLRPSGGSSARSGAGAGRGRRSGRAAADCTELSRLKRLTGSPVEYLMPDFSFALRALRARNYRLFFGGQSISLVGTWMTRIATSWLAWRLTHSAALLGVVGFAGQIPAFVLGPIAGVWVDRWNRHRALIVTQVLSMVQSFALAALALAGIITVWEIIVLALFQGLINAFDMPIRQSFVIQMVENREDLGNAIALNSSMVNAAQSGRARHRGDAHRGRRRRLLFPDRRHQLHRGCHFAAADADHDRQVAKPRRHVWPRS